MQEKLYEDLISGCVCTGAAISYIGRTALGYDIPMCSKGYGVGGVLLIGTVHAREHITTPLLLRMLAGYHGETAVDVVPMLNIDGYLLAKNGVNDFVMRVRDRAQLLRINGGSTDFSLWKANIRGVDLNTNFDARWGEGKHNIRYPAPENHIGSCPFSEPESRAVKELLDTRAYSLVVCYHSKGEEVYWGFGKNMRYRAEANAVARELGYRLKTTPDSAGGIKDYWTHTTGRLGLTIEVGSDRYPHPYPENRLEELVKRHERVTYLYANIARKLWTRYTL